MGLMSPEALPEHVRSFPVFILSPNIVQGNTGVLLGMLLVSLVVLVALVTVMSGIGVCEHCGVGSGGIYSMISTVLGGRVGGTVGLLYVFGQASNKSDFVFFLIEAF